MINEPCPLSETYGARASELSLPRAEGTIETRVVVIGGGVTGGATALRLAEAGQDVVLLEAKSIAFGGSGRAYGLIVPIAKPGHDTLITRYGKDRAERLTASLAEGPDQVYSLIDEYNIDCDAHRNGWLLAAHNPRAIEGLKARAEFWQDRGAPVDFLDTEDTRKVTGSQRYDAALLDRRCGGLNPLKYVRGLTAAAILKGAQIFENSEAISIRPGQKRRWQIITSEACIEADHVIHCTNAYTGTLWKGLQQTIIPVRAYQLITNPVSDNLFKMILPDNPVMTDTRHLFSGIRKLPDGRIHISTGGPITHANGTPDRLDAEQRLIETYPALAGLGWSDHWTAWVGVNKEQTPRITRLDEGMWAAMGYSGRGIAFGTVMGGELRKLIEAPARDDLILPVGPMRQQSFHKLAGIGAAAMVKWYGLVDRL